jgi:hypothetical protein
MVAILGAEIAALLVGCVAPGETGRLQRHAVGDVWVDALQQQLEHPEQYAVEGGLLVATPVLRLYDEDIQEYFSEHTPITGGNTSSGDAVNFALAAATLGWAGWQLAEGDRAESLEVAGESLLVTGGVTSLLKSVVNRSRPDGNSHTSFPSGHAALAFATATFLARSIDDVGDTWYHDLGYALYLPAAYVGINRIEGNRHFASDVAFGAFLGTFVTNTIYNAHYGEAANGRPGIFLARESSWSLEPVVGSGVLGVALSFRF